MVDEGLKISLEMCPTPSGPPHAPVHFGSVAIHHATEGVRQQFLKNCRRPRGPQRENRKRGRDKRPQPSFGLGLFRRRFVDSQDRLFRQLGHQFLIGRCDRRGRLILSFTTHPGEQG